MALLRDDDELQNILGLQEPSPRRLSLDATSGLARRPAVLVLLGSVLLRCTSAKTIPVAIEANFKERLTKKLNTSAEAVAEHIATRMRLDGKTFVGYELELEGTGAPKWRQGCRDLEASRDSTENCAMRQLHALAAFCDVGGMAVKSAAGLRFIREHLKQLKLRWIEGLAMKRTNFDGADIWLHVKQPNSKQDDVDASPALQASALAALVRCAEVTKQKEYLQEAEGWFQGLLKMYPRTIWNETLVSFHKTSIVWESLALVASHMPTESSFHEDIVEYMVSLESWLRQTWENAASTWSFASARALSIRWHSKLLKKNKQKLLVKKWAKEHVDRFLGRDQQSGLSSKSGDGVTQGILARIGGAGYTCGPLQGLASISAILPDAELMQVVLQLLEKDLDKYQVSSENLGVLEGTDSKFHTIGSFFRDDKQLQLEKRRSLRMDDAAQCLIALTQAIRALAAAESVKVNVQDAQMEGGEAESAGNDASNEDQANSAESDDDDESARSDGAKKADEL